MKFDYIGITMETVRVKVRGWGRSLGLVITYK